MPRLIAARGPSFCTACPTRDRARLEATQAVDDLEQLPASGTDESRKTEDLALANVEVHVLQSPQGGEIADLQHGRLPGVDLPGPAVHDFLLGADHGLDQRPGCEVLLRPLGDGDAISQHGHLVGDLEDLRQPVRHVDDADAPLLEPPDDGEEPPGFLVGERAGGLVEHEDLDIGRQRPSDLDHLLLIGPQGAHDAVRIVVDADLLEHVSGTFPRGGPIDPETPADEPVAEQDVLGDREILGECRLLGDHGDPVGEGRRWAAERDLLTAHGNRPLRRASAAPTVC